MEEDKKTEMNKANKFSDLDQLNTASPMPSELTCIEKRHMNSDIFSDVSDDQLLVRCEVRFREENKPPEIFTISNADLKPEFIGLIYDHFGNEWFSFSIILLEDEKFCYWTYGFIYNNPNLRRVKLHSYLSLWQRRNREQRDKGLNYLHNYYHILKKETFYALFFQHPTQSSDSFIKIGHTFNEMKDRRLSEYLYSEEEKYKGRIIDFTRSFLIKTDITKLEIRPTVISHKNGRRPSVESQMIRRFKSFKKYSRLAEVLDVKALPILVEVMRDCSDVNKWAMQSFMEYTGCHNSKEYLADLRRLNIC